MSPRVLLALTLALPLAGCSGAGTASPTASAALPAGFDSFRAVRYCALDGTSLQEYDARYDPTTGVTYAMDGRVASAAGGRYEPWVLAGGRYAVARPWYVDNDPIEVRGERYVKYGLPRVLGLSDVTFYDEVDGGAAFAEAGMTGTPEILYVAVRPGCEFQPYQIEE